MSNIIIITTERAPYRVKMFEELSKIQNVTVFYESNGDKSRNKEWYERKDSNYCGIDLGNNLLKNVAEVIKNIRKKQDIKVIFYEYSTKLSVVMISILKLMKIEYFINCDGMVYIDKMNLKFFLKKQLVRNATGYIAGGKSGVRYFNQFGVDESDVVRVNFTTLYQSDILKKPLSYNEKLELRNYYGIYGKNIAIAVGRFIKLKNYEELIGAWSKRPKEDILLLIGHGDLKDRYMWLIEKNKMTNVVIFDYMPKKKIMDFLRLSDVFLHPTNYDVWGLVINEALASGIPIISSDRCVAANELISNEYNGFIYKHTDMDIIHEYLNNIFDRIKFDERYSHQCLKSISNYTYEHSAKVLIEFITKRCI